MEETLNDTPRIYAKHEGMPGLFGYDKPELTRSFYNVILDHARAPGDFDYSKPQTYYAVFPDTDTEAFIEIGGNHHKKLNISNFSS